MTTLELKGGMMEQIFLLQDKRSLEELYELIAEFVKQHSEKDIWEQISDQDKIEIEKAYQESLDEANIIPHEEVVKKYGKWLRPFPVML